MILENFYIYYILFICDIFMLSFILRFQKIFIAIFFLFVRTFLCLVTYNSLYKIQNKLLPSTHKPIFKKKSILSKEFFFDLAEDQVPA
jgi:hypothetical protein